jgi:REP-associated tyrosine transposase
MARMARVVVPHYPHHVTQRGNRRQKTFFSDADYRVYLKLLAEARVESGVDIWAYCLMPNHVHIVAVPEHKGGLAHLFHTAHRQYSKMINFREGWRGHLWQERFHSFVMDELHLMTAVRYVELNPVAAALSREPQGWPWSSVHAHLLGKDNSVVTVGPMLRRVSDWSSYLSTEDDAGAWDTIRLHSRTGRPAGPKSFLEHLESITGRRLAKTAPGPKNR